MEVLGNDENELAIFKDFKQFEHMLVAVEFLENVDFLQHTLLRTVAAEDLLIDLLNRNEFASQQLNRKADFRKRAFANDVKNLIIFLTC